MNEDKNYIKVSNDLLANTTLSSTQKLFISFILGWQKNNLVCRMTNNSLASHFGMKYAGIRTLLNGLNKLPFFETTQYGATKKDSGWSSGHELKVNEEELKKFLDNEKNEADREIEMQRLANTMDIIIDVTETLKPILAELGVEECEPEDLIDNKELTELLSKENWNGDEIKKINELIEKDMLDSQEKLNESVKLLEAKLKNSSKEQVDEENSIPDLEKLNNIAKYQEDDLVEIHQIMPLLGYEHEDIQLFIEHVKENPTDYVEKNNLPTNFFISRIPFGDFFNHFTKLYEDQKYNDYDNIKITQKEMGLLEKMIG